MSKKPHKNQPKNQQPEIVDEERDPMLRALQKKVRNINKKLNEITELAARKDLKPEQEEKISKKGQTIQEREKYQEMIEVYKEIALENEKLIRKTQLSELEDLASIIAAREYGADLTATLNQSVDSLVKILTNPSRELTIQERVTQINDALIKSANNLKLKAVVKKYIEENRERRLAGEDFSNQPEPISPLSEQEREAEIKELVEEERKEIEHKVVSQEPLTPKTLSASRTAENKTEANPVITESQETESQQVISEPVNGETVQSSETNTNIEGNEATKVDKNTNPERRNERNLRGGRGRGRGGKYHEDRGEKPYKKPTFKPKYEEKNPKQNEDNSDSSEDSEPQARDFKREEVKDLINDGFIVVGKPKPKARDQKQYHDHEHGRKFHPHNQKKDY